MAYGARFDPEKTQITPFERGRRLTEGVVPAIGQGARNIGAGIKSFGENVIGVPTAQEFEQAAGFFSGLKSGLTGQPPASAPTPQPVPSTQPAGMRQTALEPATQPPVQGAGMRPAQQGTIPALNVTEGMSNADILAASDRLMQESGRGMVNVKGLPPGRFNQLSMQDFDRFTKSNLGQTMEEMVGGVREPASAVEAGGTGMRGGMEDYPSLSDPSQIFSLPYASLEEKQAMAKAATEYNQALIDRYNVAQGGVPLAQAQAGLFRSQAGVVPTDTASMTGLRRAQAQEAQARAKSLLTSKAGKSDLIKFSRETPDATGLGTMKQDYFYSPSQNRVVDPFGNTARPSQATAAAAYQSLDQKSRSAVEKYIDENYQGGEPPPDEFMSIVARIKAENR